ncbi:PulJ/GspJ family protein [Novosphingobium cyanobacteriorum]|uniref:Prepilin-type N-terminal cleavage/methylation domain-containing protein n=1 Tax=Novosphingobium cyanobacteriorum TaxID=3024215 RepID=A0ABT6CKD4_9SPHN|nr:prepilin-type N-terminal cleavage/methylation domain-containing protein [Novosphingobium cyanobacteriorum]MDF8334370.1 prepilin-type N-terminal cleavage/methylation domain-containing protein [Novosphingobium cyanobacteriorum]
MRESPAPHERGFTLTEALVALFVFGLVASLLLSVVDMQSRLALRTDRSDAAADRVVTAQGLLRHRIEALRSLPSTQGDGSTLDIIGTGTSFTFVAPGIEANGPHALQHLRIALSPQRNLTLYASTTLGGADPRLASTEGWTSLPLLGPVDWLEIAYFGPDRLTARPTWQQSWLDRSEPPQLVRIRLGLARGAPERWPLFLVRPGSALQVPCRENDRRPQCGAAS